MPRLADKGLEKRILDAAQRLWRSRGDKGLTLRAVAREARTTTTTVYKRFRNKEEIRFALAARARSSMDSAVKGASTVEECYRQFLRYAKSHPREYKLLYGPAWIRIMSKGHPRPAKEWLQKLLAERFGGQASDYEDFFYVIFLLTHGAASLISVAPAAREAKEAEENCVKICDLLLKNFQTFRGPLN
jgi:AcrR family transcriptional regulator